MTITGPFAPGKTVAQVGFSLPQAGASTTIRQTWPAALAQVFVGVEKIGDMQVSSPQLTDMREMNSGRRSRSSWRPAAALNAGDELVLNLTGIPAHSQTPRNVGARAGGDHLRARRAGSRFRRRRRTPRRTRSCSARREKLMNEVVALERKRRQKPLSAAEEARLQRVDQRARARDRRARSELLSAARSAFARRASADRLA